MAIRPIAVPGRRVSLLSTLKAARSSAARAERPSTASILESLRAEGYEIAHGVPTSRGKVDHVVFGPTGTFAIEVKSWSGKVNVTSEPRVTVGGRDEHAVIRQMHGAAVDLQGRLSRAGVTPYVVAFLAVDEAELPRNQVSIPSERVTITRSQDLPALIRAHTGSLSAAERERARLALSA
ncbi:MAG: NERD domain-containing protein [Actinobacteria bacterium]|nr:NERD domain-containing protein [Actinomycetota bacterium]